MVVGAGASVLAGEAAEAAGSHPAGADVVGADEGVPVPATG